MFMESEVLIDALLRLEAQEVPALPIHDAVIVPDYLKEEAEDVMAEAFHQHTGQRGEVSLEERRR
jgi:hypothetical protein